MMRAVLEEGLVTGSLAAEALRAAGMGVWEWNVVTGELLWDEEIASLHGLGRADFDGTLARFLSRVHPADQDFVSTAIQEAYGRGGEFHTEFRMLRPDGTSEWIQQRGRAVLDAEGTPIRMVGLGWATSRVRTTRERVGGALQHNSDGVLLVDLERALSRQDETQALVVALADSLTLDEVATVVLAHANRVLGTFFAGVALLTEDRESLRLVSLVPHPAETIAKWVDLPVTTLSAMTDAVRLGQPLYHSSRAELLAAYPHPAPAEATEGNAFANVPLLVGRRTLGTLSMSWRADRAFSDDDRSFIRMLAAQCAQAVERAQLLLRQTDVADLLQRAMLPADLPDLDRVEVSACYLPATVGLAVGGDWYDAFTLDNGSLVTVVGDVAGHGLPAAVVMSQIRNGLRAYMIEGHDPAAALTKLDVVVDLAGHGLFATVVVAIYEPKTGEVTWSNAGHPPLLLRSQQTARFLDGHIGAPVGVRGPEGHRNERLTIAPDDLLLAYTDGLIERRDEDLHVGLARLADAILHTTVPAEQSSWCEGLVDVVLTDSVRQDDVCILSLQRLS